MALAEAVRAVTGVDAALKWPNDVHVRGRKLGGILAERPAGAGDAVVLGYGLNVSAVAPPDALAALPEHAELDWAKGTTVAIRHKHALE